MKKRIVSKALLSKILLPRRADGHKGDYGHALILAGSPGMLGAGILAARAGLASGAGLVTLGVPNALWFAAAITAPPEALTFGFKDGKKGRFDPGAVPEILSYIRRRRVTAIAVGMGVSTAPSTAAFINKFRASVETPLLLDADALTLMAAAGNVQTKGPVLLTPHPGEAARLLGASIDAVQKNRERAVLSLSRKTGAVCVLKGKHTLMTDGSRLFVNPTGNPGMASGGMGDILAGLIAGLFGQVEGNSPRERLFNAAMLGAYIHGSAGDLAAQRGTRLTLTASDLLTSLPAAFRRLFGEKI